LLGLLEDVSHVGHVVCGIFLEKVEVIILIVYV